MEYVFVTIFEKKSVFKPLIGTHKNHALIKSLTFLVSLFFDTWEFNNIFNILQTIIIIAKVLWLNNLIIDTYPHLQRISQESLIILSSSDMVKTVRKHHLNDTSLATSFISYLEMSPSDKVAFNPFRQRKLKGLKLADNWHLAALSFKEISYLIDHTLRILYQFLNNS